MWTWRPKPEGRNTSASDTLRGAGRRRPALRLAVELNGLRVVPLPWDQNRAADAPEQRGKKPVDGNCRGKKLFNGDAGTAGKRAVNGTPAGNKPFSGHLFRYVL